MKLTLFSDYSLRILIYAALRQEERFSVVEVAQAYQLSRNHAAKAVNFLTQRSYLRAQRGPGGGLCLAQAATAIRVGAVVRLTETGAPLVECFTPASNTCPLIHVCLLQRALAEAWTAFFHTLDQYTLADLVRQPNPLRQALQLPL